MAGHDEGHRVAPDRRADRPRRLWRADMSGRPPNRWWRAQRNAQQRLPDAHLEIRADEHDPQRRRRAPCARCRRRGARRAAVASASSTKRACGQRRRMSASAAASPAVVDEADAGEPARRDHHERLAEGRGMEAVAQLEARAAALAFARAHRLVRHEEVVQATGARQAELVSWCRARWPNRAGASGRGRASPPAGKPSASAPPSGGTGGADATAKAPTCAAISSCDGWSRQRAVMKASARRDAVIVGDGAVLLEFGDRGGREV